MSFDRMAVLAKFEENYIPEPNSGCWLWDGYCISTGYGQMTVARLDRRLAHRVSYELFKGPIPWNYQVRHKYDTKLCVNPDHLLIGTDQDNRTDMAKRERGTFGNLPLGVSRHRKKFAAKVKYQGYYYHYGVYDTIEEAAAVVAEKRQKFYG
jgi:hypothetical protein